MDRGCVHSPYRRPPGTLSVTRREKVACQGIAGSPALDLRMPATVDAIQGRHSEVCTTHTHTHTHTHTTTATTMSMHGPEQGLYAQCSAG